MRILRLKDNTSSFIELTPQCAVLGSFLLLTALNNLSDRFENAPVWAPLLSQEAEILAGAAYNKSVTICKVRMTLPNCPPENVAHLALIPGICENTVSFPSLKCRIL